MEIVLASRNKRKIEELETLLGQALPLKKAVTAAVYLHGKSGDMCRDALGEYFMTPSDITDGLAAVLKNATR